MKIKFALLVQDSGFLTIILPYPDTRSVWTRVPGEIKWREVDLDPQVSPEEIMSREVELGCESWTSFASSYSSTAVQRTMSL